MKNKFLAIFLVLGFLCLSLSAKAEVFTGKVVGVHDGDTITVLDEGRHATKIRLAEIDTPETGQPYGSKAKQELSALVFSKEISVSTETTDRYGRTVAHVSVDGMDVNREMVRRGAAWVYRAYLKDKSLLTVESEARAAKRGLWGLPEAEQTPPWEWRKLNKASHSKVNHTKASQNLTPINPLLTPVFSKSCCKICTKGKPCGDSCISVSKTCHKGVGCAC